MTETTDLREGEMPDYRGGAIDLRDASDSLSGTTASGARGGVPLDAPQNGSALFLDAESTIDLGDLAPPTVVMASPYAAEPVSDAVGVGHTDPEATSRGSGRAEGFTAASADGADPGGSAESIEGQGTSGGLSGSATAGVATDLEESAEVDAAGPGPAGHAAGRAIPSLLGKPRAQPTAQRVARADVDPQHATVDGLPPGVAAPAESVATESTDQEDAPGTAAPEPAGSEASPATPDEADPRATVPSGAAPADPEAANGESPLMREGLWRRLMRRLRGRRGEDAAQALGPAEPHSRMELETGNRDVESAAQPLDVNSFAGASRPPISPELADPATASYEGFSDMAQEQLAADVDWYEASKATFLGKIGDTVARSLDQADAAVRSSSEPLQEPDVSFLPRHRRDFQRSVWLFVVLVPIAWYVFLKYGDPLVWRIQIIPRMPDGPWNVGGVPAMVTAAVQDFYSHKWAWALTVTVILALWAWRKLKQYFRSDMRATDEIRAFRVASTNQVVALETAKSELARLQSLNSAFSPQAEILAWLIHEPAARPDGGAETEHRAYADPTGIVLPNAVRLGAIEITDRFRHEEQRTAVEQEAGRGFLSTVLNDAASSSHEDVGLAGKDVITLLDRSDAAGSGRDVRPGLLRQMRSGVIVPPMFEQLRARLVAHRRALVVPEPDGDDEGGNQGLRRATVTMQDGVTVPLDRFVSDVCGPATSFMSDIWTNARVVDGANAARDGALVHGEFRTYLWGVPQVSELAAGASPQDGGVFAIAATVAADEVIVGSLRLDMMQEEPVGGFACFGRTSTIRTPLVFGEDDL